MKKSPRKTSKPARPRRKQNHPNCDQTVADGLEVATLVAAAVDAVKLPQEEVDMIARRRPGRR